MKKQERNEAWAECLVLVVVCSVFSK